MSGKNVTEVRRADAAGIARAAAILESGGLVAVPTETVYGLAARADRAEAVARIYAAKGRPDFNPLIVHVKDAAQAARYAEFVGRAGELAERYWPGPLTLVLPLRRDAGLAPAVTAGLASVAVRAPAGEAMRQLLGRVDLPLAAPSANRSGFVSPTSAAHVLATLDGRVDLILEDNAGSCDQGIESTIVAVSADGSIKQLRPGPIAVNDLMTAADMVDANDQPAQITAPGQLASHYSPGKPMRLEVTKVAPDDFMIGFGAIAGDCTLSPVGDLSEAAARLYDCLHQAAGSEKPSICVAPIPEEGIGQAINDRLRRAASPPD